MIDFIKRLGAVYILLMLWLVAIPATATYSLIIGITCMTNPIEVFNSLAEEFTLHVAWDWKQIKYAIFRKR